MNSVGLVARTALAVGAVLVVAIAAPAQSGNSPLTEEEQVLERVDDNVIEVQRALSAARKRGADPEKLGKLQKKFDKLQKKRVGLLRATWQM